MNQAQKDLKNLATNVKNTETGASFVKTLFTDPNRLSPKQITATLKALGLQIPPELLVTAEVAQIVVTGQAINNSVQAGKNLADVKSLTTSTGASLRIINGIAAHNGWFDSDTASVVSYGVNVGMLIATSGTDVSSWIGLAMDVAITDGSKRAEADIKAYKDAQKKLTSMLTGQSKILGETFKDFQENKIGIYGVIAKMAVETPTLWPQVIKPDSPFVKMFPDLMMVPTTQQSVWGYGESAIQGDYPWPANGRYIINSWNSSKPIPYYEVQKMNKEQAAEYFFTILLKPWLWCYSIANDEVLARGNMSMENIAALSYIINPSGEISDRQDYVSALIGARLTPYDFDDRSFDNVAQEFVYENFKGRDVKFYEEAVSIGRNTQSQGFLALTSDQEKTRESLERVKRSSDIYELVQYPYFYQRLQKYMDFEQVSFEKDPSFGGKINEVFPERTTRAWRKLHNYISVLHMLDQFRNDSYLKTTKFAQDLVPFMPSIDSFEQKVQNLNYLSTMRNVNSLALKNLADILGVKPSQLLQVTPQGHNGPTQYKIL